MNQRINTVSALHFAALSSIVEFTPTGSGSVQVSAGAWQPVPFVAGAVKYECNQETEKGSILFETTLSAKISKALEIPNCILRIDFEDDDSIIIGDPDLPVIFSHSKALLLKTINTTHVSWHEPYTLVI